jgi:ABC-type transporter Mla subunit MlaD
MRRLIALALLVASVGAISLLGSGAGGDSGHYLVDAEFRNAFSVIEGEDVKIAGVKVGKIKSLDVTPRQTASVVLDITLPGFGDWRSDAECTIRPQSLIGEKFVECTPTQPRPAGAQPAPLLKTRKQDGETMAILPVSQTRRPIDIDLVQNTLRLPYRERLTVLLNEFGAGVAGRGADLRRIIRTADPALKATDDVLNLLAGQNQVLRKLAVDSDTALAPIARDRGKVADFVTQSKSVAQATAARRVDLERNLQRLPTFLRTLRPTMDRLGSLSEQGTPLLRDLNAVGPDLSRFIKQLGPFSASATPALVSLGDASVVGRTALNKSRPIISDLKDFAGSSKQLSADLRELTDSLRGTGGIDRLMDYAFYQVAAVNGFDQFGHYLRAQLLVNLCSQYATTPDQACLSKFTSSSANTRSARAALANVKNSDDPVLARTDAVLRGNDPAEVLAAGKATDTPAPKRSSDAAKPAAADGAISLPSQLLPGGSATNAAAPAPAAATPAPSGTTGPSSQTAPNSGVSSLLDYLMGGGK